MDLKKSKNRNRLLCCLNNNIKLKDSGTCKDNNYS